MSRRLAGALLALALLGLPACGGDTPGTEELPPTEPGAVPPGGFAEDQVELALEDQVTNDTIGSAIFSPEGETSTHVFVLLDEAPPEGGSAEIRRGRCEQPESEVLHELGALEDGNVEATVDTALEDLLAAEHAIWAVGADGRDLGCALIAPFGTELD